MKNIILISFLIMTLSKINEIEFGKEMTFDKNNNELELTFPSDGILLIAVKFSTSNIVNLKMTFPGIDFNKMLDSSEFATIIPFYKDRSNKITLEYKTNSDEKGKIWLHPSTNEIKVDLNQIYEWKYDIKSFFPLSKKYQLTYSIDNAEKDAIFEFKYNDKFEVDNNFLSPNPLKICNGEICKTDLNTYEIKKGESYKIYININFVEKNAVLKFLLNIYYLPNYSFHFIYKEEEKKEENIIGKEKDEKEKEVEREEEEEEEEEKREEIGNKERKIVQKKEEEEKKIEKQEKEKQEERIEEEEEKEEKEEEETIEKEKKEEEKKKEQEIQKKEEEQKKEKFLDLNNLSKWQIAGIITLGILLLGGIVLSIFLICRKRSKSNKEIDSSQSMKFSLANENKNEIPDTLYLE